MLEAYALPRSVRVVRNTRDLLREADIEAELRPITPGGGWAAVVRSQEGATWAYLRGLSRMSAAERAAAVPPIT